jgi:antitoxin component of MazEF toxin-antitoxin module
MSVRLCRWGHSTGLRIPVAVLSAAGLAPGRSVSLRVLDNGDIRVRPIGQVVPAEPVTAEGRAVAGAAPEPEVW